MDTHMTFQFVSYGWDEKHVNTSVCGFSHPSKDLVVVAYDNSNILTDIPLLKTFVSEKEWVFAVIDESQEEILISKQFDSRLNAFEEVQEYLSDHRIV